MANLVRFKIAISNISKNFNFEYGINNCSFYQDQHRNNDK